MLNLITSLSLGCFDALNIPGDIYVYENDEGELIVEHVTETDYMVNTMTYCLTTKDEIKSMIAYLKHLLKVPFIRIFDKRQKQ